MQAYSAVGSKMSQITVTNELTDPVTRCANETNLMVDIPFTYNNFSDIPFTFNNFSPQ